MPSIVCWSWDARSLCASPDPKRGWGDCASSSGPCNTPALARMAHPGGEPVRTGLLGLPLAEINWVRAAEARARDQQRRRRLAAAAAKPWTSAAP
jgi:hypothetical protein